MWATDQRQSWVDELMGGAGEYDVGHPLVAWLRAALERCDIKPIPEPKTVTVRKFEMDWPQGVGTFTVAFDGKDLEHRFSCMIPWGFTKETSKVFNALSSMNERVINSDAYSRAHVAIDEGILAVNVRI